MVIYDNNTGKLIISILPLFDGLLVVIYGNNTGLLAFSMHPFEKLEIYNVFID